MLLKNIVILIALSALTALFFNGCSQTPKVIVKTVYVHTKCPKLQTYDINTTKIKDFKLDYKVIK